MNKRILISGGAGFIGSNLCQKLLNAKNDILCLDNLSTGSLLNIKKMEHYKNFTFINHDITKKIDIDVDEIYNLACPASPIQYQNNPIKTLKTSVIGSINLLDLALKNNSKILQASTSEIYGNPLLHPQVENYWGNVNPIGTRACYDEGKRCAETLFVDYKRQHKINIRIARIFNTYGPHMASNDGRVISNFIVQALKDENITIYGNGYQTRSFCYVEDMIDALIKLMNNKILEPVNLGNDEEISIIDVAKLIIELTKSKSKITFQKLPEDDPIRRKPDLNLAKENLSWCPSTSFEDGLLKTISFFKTLSSL